MSRVTIYSKRSRAGDWLAKQALKIDDHKLAGFSPPEVLRAAWVLCLALALLPIHFITRKGRSDAHEKA